MSNKDNETKKENDSKILTADNTSDQSDTILPDNKVFCFPANKKQITVRRIVTSILGLASIAGIVFFLIPDTQNYIFSAILLVIFVINLLVFVQTFLIASFRVALDYNEKKVVLRYMFRRLHIDFENFDARDGVPDKAEQMIRQHAVGTERQNRMFLILDDVHADACYQTTSADLASIADFLKLKEEAFKIASVYKAKEKTDALKNSVDEKDQSDYQSLISEVMEESKEPDNEHKENEE